MGDRRLEKRGDFWKIFTKVGIRGENARVHLQRQEEGRDEKEKVFQSEREEQR